MDSYTIYPKQFRNARIPVEKNRCFVLMPFSDGFDNIYGNIKKSLHENGYICNRADEIIGSKPIMNKILNEIMRAHYIIADLTQQNPNVFYELGIAHTFKDAQNIILITQKVSDIPFDIRHINNIVYTSDNIKYLTSSVLQVLNESKYLIGFHEALVQKGIIDLIHDNKDEFVNYLQANLADKVSLSSDILNNKLNDLNDGEIELYFKILLEIINNAVDDGNYNYLSGLLRVLSESIVSCSKFNITDKITHEFLYGNLFGERLRPDKIELISYQTDFAICLASQRAKLSTAMNWIINYFSNSKSATIDLNRYKVERFLMVSGDKMIDSMIIDSVFHENCYIREHLADVIGEKKLYEAGDVLLSQLLLEDNYFSAVSIISAIGKLGVSNGADTIMTWLADNQENIIRTNQLFVLKHISISLTRLDKKNNSAYYGSFQANYGSLLKDYFIL